MKKCDLNNESSLKVSSVKQYAVKAAGALLGYGIGQLVGEVADHVPLINEYVPAFLDYIANLNPEGNLNGFGAIVGMISGWRGSGYVTDMHIDLPFKGEKSLRVKIGPFSRKLEEKVELFYEK